MIIGQKCIIKLEEKTIILTKKKLRKLQVTGENKSLKSKKFTRIFALVMLFLNFVTIAEATGLPSVSINVDGATSPLEVTSSIQILLIISVLTLAPSLIVITPSFTRFVVVFYFLRAALGTQSTPPNQVLVGLALFMTLFLMMPIFSRIKTDA